MPPSGPPVHCRPDAFAYMAQQLPHLHTSRGLMRAAAAVAMHELEHVDVPRCEAMVADLTARLTARVRGRSVDAVLAHAHELLFDELGFAGNQQAYHLTDNSYLPLVLETRRGLPITLCLVYKLVLEPLGLKVYGINAPGHFLAGVDRLGRNSLHNQQPTRHGLPHEVMLIDPFYTGRLITHDQAVERIEEMTGALVDEHTPCLRPASHRVWLTRILFNLENAFRGMGQSGDVNAMIEMRRLIAQRRDQA